MILTYFWMTFFSKEDVRALDVDQGRKEHMQACYDKSFDLEFGILVSLYLNYYLYI